MGADCCWFDEFMVVSVDCPDKKVAAEAAAIMNIIAPIIIAVFDFNSSPPIDSVIKYV